MADPPPRSQPKLWRQGDILIQEHFAPDEATRAQLVRRKKPILAEGEHTGHRHEVAGRRAARLYSLPKTESQLLEIVAERADVIHPEHGPISLTRGWYRVWRQREWNGWGFSTVGD